jgi:catechol-2,3-dioxygenase
MPGIIFLKTRDLEGIARFYTGEIGMGLWLDQGACKILRKDNLLLGFCAADAADTQGTITFFYHTPRDVDLMYKKITAEKVSWPMENEKYKIYHFYAKDPEGRSIEFQTFLGDIDWDFGP